MYAVTELDTPRRRLQRLKPVCPRRRYFKTCRPARTTRLPPSPMDLHPACLTQAGRRNPSPSRSAHGRGLHVVADLLDEARRGDPHLHGMTSRSESLSCRGCGLRAAYSRRAQEARICQRACVVQRRHQYHRTARGRSASFRAMQNLFTHERILRMRRRRAISTLRDGCYTIPAEAVPRSTLNDRRAFNDLD